MPSSSPARCIFHSAILIRIEKESVSTKLFDFMCFQGAQAIGMGKEAQNVPAAAILYKKANEILG